MTNSESLQFIITVLEHVRSRPGIYFTPTMPESAFINGFHLGLGVAKMGLQEGSWRAAFKAVLLERGWEYGAIAPDYEMEQRGLSHNEKFIELVTIELETWKRVLGEGSTT